VRGICGLAIREDADDGDRLLGTCDKDNVEVDSTGGSAPHYGATQAKVVPFDQVG